MQMQAENRADQVRIVEFKETKVAAFEHRGDPKSIDASIRKFIEWRQQNRLPPKLSVTFNIAYDDPDETAPHAFRFDLCAATDQDMTGHPFMVNKLIPGGRCAVLRHIGSDDALAQTIRSLYTEWLQSSGEQLRDFPLYFQRVRTFPDVPEHEAVTDVFLPLERKPSA
jgi:AraC family transcriptional regulator